jgi:hypothetical protein
VGRKAGRWAGGKGRKGQERAEKYEGKGQSKYKVNKSWN